MYADLKFLWDKHMLPTNNILLEINIDLIQLLKWFAISFLNSMPSFFKGKK